MYNLITMVKGKWPQQVIKCFLLHQWQCVWKWLLAQQTRGSVDWACVAHLSFCFEKLNTEPSIGDFHQISVDLAKQSLRRVLEINQPETRVAYDSHIWIGTNLALFIEHLPYVSYQVSVHLAKRFQRRRFWEIDQSETRIACGSHVC